jgi:hypothetical protein
MGIYVPIQEGNTPMAANIEQLRSSIQAFLDTIANLSAGQRRNPPPDEMVERLNGLIDLSCELMPGVDPRLMPAKLTRELEVLSYGTSFALLDANARQLLAVFNT